MAASSKLPYLSINELFAGRPKLLKEVPRILRKPYSRGQLQNYDHLGVRKSLNKSKVRNSGTKYSSGKVVSSPALGFYGVDNPTSKSLHDVFGNVTNKKLDTNKTFDLKSSPNIPLKPTSSQQNPVLEKPRSDKDNFRIEDCTPPTNNPIEQYIYQRFLKSTSSEQNPVLEKPRSDKDNFRIEDCILPTNSTIEQIIYQPFLKSTSSEQNPVLEKPRSDKDNFRIEDCTLPTNSPIEQNIYQRFLKSTSSEQNPVLEKPRSDKDNFRIEDCTLPTNSPIEQNIYQRFLKSTSSEQNPVLEKPRSDKDNFRIEDCTLPTNSPIEQNIYQRFLKSTSSEQNPVLEKPRSDKDNFRIEDCTLPTNSPIEQNIYQRFLKSTSSEQNPVLEKPRSDKDNFRIEDCILPTNNIFDKNSFIEWRIPDQIPVSPSTMSLCSSPLAMSLCSSPSPSINETTNVNSFRLNDNCVYTSVAGLVGKTVKQLLNSIEEMQNSDGLTLPEVQQLCEKAGVRMSYMIECKDEQGLIQHLNYTLDPGDHVKTLIGFQRSNGSKHMVVLTAQKTVDGQIRKSYEDFQRDSRDPMHKTSSVSDHNPTLLFYFERENLICANGLPKVVSNGLTDYFQEVPMPHTVHFFPKGCLLPRVHEEKSTKLNTWLTSLPVGPNWHSIPNLLRCKRHQTGKRQ